MAIIAFTGALLWPAFGSKKKNEELFRESQRPIYGIVTEEKYENYTGEAKREFAFSGRRVKYSLPVSASRYTLKVRLDNEEELAVSVFDSEDTKKESLDMLINPGSRISFPRGNLRWRGDHFGVEGETYFTPEIKIGSKRADRIKVQY